MIKLDSIDVIAPSLDRRPIFIVTKSRVVLAYVLSATTFARCRAVSFFDPVRRIDLTSYTPFGGPFCGYAAHITADPD